MKLKLLLIIMLIICTGLSAIDVSGDQSGTWTLANSPYNVTADVNVPAGQTLTIEPGVIVNINGLYQIKAVGVINAQGTETDSIRFLSTSRWKGFRLESTTQTSNFKHCYIEKVDNGINPINSPVNIIKCRINDALNNCISIYGIGGPANTLIKQSKISGSIKSGINISQNSNVVIDSCEIYNNGLGTQYFGGIHLQNQSVNGENNPMISNNWIHHNAKQGINSWDVTSNSRINPTIINNIIENNLTGVYLRHSSGIFQNNIVRNNFITGNANSGAGIMISGASAHPVVAHNQIYGNYTGFYIGEGAVPNLGYLTAIPEMYNEGRNTIINNVDGSGVPHSIVIYSGIGNVMAQNNIWGTYDTALIDQSITDQLDNAALGLVTYTPLYYPYNLEGTVTYAGTLEFDQIFLLLYDYIAGEVQTMIPVAEDGSFQFDAPQGNYYLQAYGANGSGDEIEILAFGIYGGIMGPIPLHFDGNTVYSDITIEMFDYQENTTIEILSSYTYENLTVYPMAISTAYGIEQVILLFESGDYIYIYGEMIYNPDTLEWEPEYSEPVVMLKNHNLNNGDFWENDSENAGMYMGPTNEIMSIEGVEFYPARIIYANGSVFDDSNIMSKTYFKEDLGVVMMRSFNEESHELEFEQRLVSYDVSYGGSGLFPLASGNRWELENTELPEAPSFLSLHTFSEAQIFLHWDAPAGNDWLGYRVYRDDQIFTNVSFATNSLIIGNIPNYSASSWYVKAYNNSGESESSNIIAATDNDLPNPNPGKLSISHYPNPVSYNTKSIVSFSFHLPEAAQVQINLFNIKGQKVDSITDAYYEKGEHRINWDALGKNNKALSNGIYFYQMKSGKQTISKKLIILKK